jgi:hypothetical protein
MTTMLARTYAGLKAAGVSDEQAQAAVEELGHMNDQFGGLGQAMQEMHVAMKSGNCSPHPCESLHGQVCG